MDDVLPMSVPKIVTFTEQTLQVACRQLEAPTRKVVAAAVIQNSFAGSYVHDLEPMFELGARLSALLTEHELKALGEAAGHITSYGKGAIGGTNGELEHAAALPYAKFGTPPRALIGGGKAIIPGTMKIGGAGSTTVMPLTNRYDIWSLDEMDAAEMATRTRRARTKHRWPFASAPAGNRATASQLQEMRPRNLK